MTSDPRAGATPTAGATPAAGATPPAGGPPPAGAASPAGAAATGGATAGPANGGAPVIDQLRQLLAEVTGRQELRQLPGPASLLGPGAGIGSLSGTLLLRRIKDQFGVDVAAEDLSLDALATLTTLTEFIEARVPAPGR